MVSAPTGSAKATVKKTAAKKPASGLLGLLLKSTIAYPFTLEAPKSCYLLNSEIS
jgi:hypothetical protein